MKAFDFNYLNSTLRHEAAMMYLERLVEDKYRKSLKQIANRLKVRMDKLISKQFVPLNDLSDGYIVEIKPKIIIHRLSNSQVKTITPKDER